MRLFILFFCVIGNIFAQNPVLSSFVSSDPDNLDGYLSVNDVITFTFDVPTNTPAVATKAQIDALMTFSQALGSNYSGVWTTNQILVITILNVGGNGNPEPGTTTVSLTAGGIRDITNAFNAVSGPFILTGNWGTGSDKLFFGGIGSGFSQSVFQNPFTCISFFGGINDGYDTTLYINPFTCPMLGGSGGPYSSGLDPGICVMYWGNQSDGYASDVRNSTFTCGTFMGDDADGYHAEIFSNPFACVSFFGQPGQGYNAQVYQTPYKCVYFSGPSDGFSIDSSGCVLITLPVLHSQLTATLQDSIAFLNWQTFMEKNCIGFEMQKSLDAKNWTNFHFETGQGNSTQISEYMVPDSNVAFGTTYYRFIQKDIDGRFAISNVVSVYRKPINQVTIQVFPNPVKQNQEIQCRIFVENPSEQLIHFQLLDLSGHVLISKEVLLDNQTLNIPTTNISSGLYLLQWKSSQFSGFQKILIVI